MSYFLSCINESLCVCVCVCDHEKRYMRIHISTESGWLEQSLDEERDDETEPESPKKHVRERHRRSEVPRRESRGMCIGSKRRKFQKFEKTGRTEKHVRKPYF